MRRSSIFTAAQTRLRRPGVIAPWALAFCAAGSMLPASLADVIHVPRDQPTIQAGIDVASDGDGDRGSDRAQPLATEGGGDGGSGTAQPLASAGSSTRRAGQKELQMSDFFRA